MSERAQKQVAAERLPEENQTPPRVTVWSASTVARRDIKPYAAPIGSAVYVVENGTRLRYVRPSLLFLRVRKARVTKMTMTPSSAAKKQRPSCATREASYVVMNRLIMGAVGR